MTTQLRPFIENLLKCRRRARTLPLLLNIVRQKTGVSYRTFFGADAVKYLRGYLSTRRELNYDSPLFTKQGTDNTRITIGLMQSKFREIAKECEFVKNNGGYNPARPHSFRSAFRSRLTGKMDGDLIEYFMGHKLPESKKAYMNIPSDELRELYAQFEHELSIENTSKNVLTGRVGEAKKVEKFEKRIVELERMIGERTVHIEQLNKGIEKLAERLGSLEGLKERIEELEDYVEIGVLRKEAKRV